jgi:hypothetical protein
VLAEDPCRTRYRSMRSPTWSYRPVWLGKHVAYYATSLFIFFRAVLKIQMLYDLHKLTNTTFFSRVQKVKRNTEGGTYCGSM